MHISNMIRKLVVFTALVSVTAVMPVYAEEETPITDIKVSTPAYQISEAEFAPRYGTYTYKVSWQGITAAECQVVVSDEGQRVRIIASAKTYSGIDIFYKLRYRAEALLEGAGFAPVMTLINQRENSKIKTTQISFRPNGDIESVRSQPGKQPEIIRFNPHNYTLDPFAASFVARGLDWKLGETKEFDTFNGKSRYLIKLTAKEKVKMSVNGVQRDAWVIYPAVENLTYPHAKKKLREAKMYVTADEERELLQIVSEVFVGSVTTKLVSFEPAGDPKDAVQVASRTEAIRFKVL